MKKIVYLFFVLTLTLFLSACGVKDAPRSPRDPKLGLDNACGDRLRGAMIGLDVDEDDLRELASWGANHVRWQLLWDSFPFSPADKAEPFEYDAWLEKELSRLDRLMPVCEELGLKIVIDLHTPPGGRTDKENEFRLFTDGQWRSEFSKTWHKIAERYKGKEIVWAYDLLNEPYDTYAPVGFPTWRELAEKTIKMIRSIEPDKKIIFEPALDRIGRDHKLEPFAYENIVYSVHMYAPGEFTHQGVGGRPVGIEYPGEINGVYWNKEKMQEYFEPLIAFQKENKAEIYIGEFSAIRWAPKAELWLRDVTEIIEENGWNAAYHAFREWDGWSVEHNSNPDDHKEVNITPRKSALISWFSLNSCSE